MKRFVLVSAVMSSPGKQDLKGSGIRKLKRGVALGDFVNGFFSDPALAGIYESVHVFERGDTWTAVYSNDGAVYMWSFTPYVETDLRTAVKYLSRAELLRDLKELQPLKELKL